ncbi:MAG: hypothetical protein IJY36_05280 [Coprobacter sp.]|nr:hypothetical protein [Coprobacter sp.]
MHKFAYILPIFTIAIIIWAFPNIGEVSITCGVLALLSEFILWRIIRRASRTKEYLSAFAYNVQHHEAWVERIERYETYTDSRGNTRRRVVVDYQRHPECWLMCLNTGVDIYIYQNVYDMYRMLWGTPEHWIDPYHPNCVSGGGGQLYEWNNVYEDAATHTYEGLYVNYINNSNSIFRKGKVSDYEVEELGLIDYPVFVSNYIETDVILGSPNLPKCVGFSEKSQRAFQLINAIFGAERQIHVFILVFNAKQDVTTALRQQAYWQGGNKNEFVVCLGVDFSNVEAGKGITETRQPIVQWCKAFSWSDVPLLESATESWFIANKELNFAAYAKWLRENIHLWERKEFTDFKYLGLKLSPKRMALVFITAVLFCVINIIISCGVAYYLREYNYYISDKYQSIGYELLDKYIVEKIKDDTSSYKSYP